MPRTRDSGAYAPPPRPIPPSVAESLENIAESMDHISSRLNVLIGIAERMTPEHTMQHFASNIAAYLPEMVKAMKEVRGIVEHDLATYAQSAVQSAVQSAPRGKRDDYNEADAYARIDSLKKKLRGQQEFYVDEAKVREADLFAEARDQFRAAQRRAKQAHVRKQASKSRQPNHTRPSED